MPECMTDSMCRRGVPEAITLGSMCRREVLKLGWAVCGGEEIARVYDTGKYIQERGAGVYGSKQ